MSEWRRLLIAALAGAAGGLPYVALALPSILAPICLAPLARLAVVYSRPGYGSARRWTIGYVAAVSQTLVVFHWLPKLTQQNLVYDWIMWPALLLTALYLGIFGGVAFFVSTWITGRRGWPIVWTLPLAWCVLEWLRAQGDIGFPWGAFGYAWWAAPLMIQSADVWGIFGLGFVTLAVASRLALPSRRHALEAAVALAMLAGYGALRLREAPPTRTLDVAVIQPNWSAAEKWAPENTARVFARYIEQSETVLEEGAALVVWPETATPFRLLDAPSHLRRMQYLADTHRSPLIAGTVHHETLEGGETRYHNSAVLITPGPIEPARYDKRYLMPFSEWLPWHLLRIMEINFGQADFTPGTSASPFSVNGEAAGMLICIEAMLPRFARASTSAGATFLVNITNDVWFGDGPAIHHHADMARFRAVELRRPIVRSANTGISMLVDRTGRVEDSLGAFRQGIFRGAIHPESTRTVYSEVGDAGVAIAATVLLLLAVFRRHTRMHGSRGA